MRKQNLFLTLILIFCFSVVGGIWLLVRQKLSPISFSPIVNAELTFGFTKKTRSLASQELIIVKNWIGRQGSGWEPLRTNPPSLGDAELRFNVGLDKQVYQNLPYNQRPQPFSFILWLGLNQADWNNKIFLEKNVNGQDTVFFKNCNSEEFQPLRGLVEQYRDQRVDIP
ncbi:hypothetical protein COMNV_01458 [Commensalibacter sp. Nvir]|uniref:hypothetical protein n=1 Tax=Commensalibacter sp. Nvir TaxID=3069817 RepID=UPI002D5DE7E8|nr:hypothetical protein COMNV_01458 [Commensalibacter sp. Nvir]